MAATFFQDFTRDNGQLVTVEYSFAPGSETTYSPRYGADGGDAAEVVIIRAWPNTPQFDALCGRHNALAWSPSRSSWQWLTLLMVDARIWFAERRCRLTDVERERMELWLIEHHESEYDDWEF